MFDEVEAYRKNVRMAYNSSQFDKLEKFAAEAREGKARLGNGIWKITHFHQALACREDEPESMWELHDRIHEAWIAAKPESITARVAHADFLTEYAWHARGSGFAGEVTDKGWHSFKVRLGKSRKVLEKARDLPAKDPVWWQVAMRVALGQGWEKKDFDALVADAVAFEPRYFEYDKVRAYSLLPRWHGEEGDWEAYAEEAAARKDGLGAETYARIVMELRGYYDNVFQETKASWPRTKEGLLLMLERFPDSVEIRNVIPMMAVLAQDREFAKEAFDRLDGTYLPLMWRKPQRYVHYRHWAETGEW